MKKLFIIAIVAMATFATGCERTIFPTKIEDKPNVEFYEESMTVAAEGGEMIIPVLSTGIDNVTILLENGDSWEEVENGDMLPKDSWIKIVKVINEYDNATRALAQWDSGISIIVEPNTTNSERKACITVQSFTVNDTIVITQSAE